MSNLTVSSDVDSFMQAADKTGMRGAVVVQSTGFAANGDSGNPAQPLSSFSLVDFNSADGGTFINTYPEAAAIIVGISNNLGNIAARVIALNAALKANGITDN